MRPIRKAAIREIIRVATLKSSMTDNIAARFRRVNFPYGGGDRPIRLRGAVVAVGLGAI